MLAPDKISPQSIDAACILTWIRLECAAGLRTEFWARAKGFGPRGWLQKGPTYGGAILGATFTVISPSGGPKFGPEAVLESFVVPERGGTLAGREIIWVPEGRLAGDFRPGFPAIVGQTRPPGPL